MTSGPLPVIGVVPAAGQSSRFGSMKLLADIDGVALVDRTIGCLLAAGVPCVVLVVSGPGVLAASALASDPRVVVVTNPDASRGMFSSIQVGLAAVVADLALVLPGDMPFVHAATISAVLNAARLHHAVTVPTHEGRRGHPIAIPGSLARELCMDDPTSNLKAALAARGRTTWEVPVDDRGILRDVDVPADLT